MTLKNSRFFLHCKSSWNMFSYSKSVQYCFQYLSTLINFWLWLIPNTWFGQDCVSHSFFRFFEVIRKINCFQKAESSHDKQMWYLSTTERTWVSFVSLVFVELTSDFYSGAVSSNRTKFTLLPVPIFSACFKYCE